MDPALELDAVTKSWDAFALRNVSFRLPRGYITGLVGPNGAGKSTIIRLVLDLVRPDTGRVRLFGGDPRTRGRSLRSKVGFVHDRPISYDHLSVEAMGAVVAPFYADWDETAFSRLLREFEVPPSRKVSALSRGMRMKAGLAIALSHRAELLVLDEPTTGLDPVFRRDLLERLSALIGDGRTSVLFSTQILGDLERIADFVVFLRRGEVQYEGPKDDLVDRWGVIRGGSELAAELDSGVVRGLRHTAMGIEALVEDVEAARRRFGGRAVVERATLDDVFLLLGASRDQEARR